MIVLLLYSLRSDRLCVLLQLMYAFFMTAWVYPVSADLACLLSVAQALLGSMMRKAAMQAVLCQALAWSCWHSIALCNLPMVRRRCAQLTRGS